MTLVAIMCGLVALGLFIRLQQVKTKLADADYLVWKLDVKLEYLRETQHRLERTELMRGDIPYGTTVAIAGTDGFEYYKRIDPAEVTK